MYVVLLIISKNDQSFAQPPIISARLQVGSPLRFHIRTYTTAVAAPFETRFKPLSSLSHSSPRSPASIILAMPPSHSVHRSPIQSHDQDAT